MAQGTAKVSPLSRRVHHAAAILAILLLAALAIPAHAEPGAAVPAAIEPGRDEIALGNDHRPVLALTFDAGAGAGPALRLLDVLRQKDVRGTFFLTGLWARQNPPLVQQIVQDGHELANHTWSHRDLTRLSPAAVEDEIGRAEDLLTAASGKPTKPLFRFPYGARNARLQDQVAALGYRSIYWTVDSLDWMDTATADSITTRVLNGARNGAIVLMHVGATYTNVALPTILDTLRARGFTFETVTEAVT